MAHVYNLTRRKLRGVGYRWLLDGKVVESGEARLRRRGATTFELPWTWTARRHELVFEIDPSGSITEVEERNNRLLVHTDALAVGFWVEKRFWRRMRPVVAAADIETTTDGTGAIRVCNPALDGENVALPDQDVTGERTELACESLTAADYDVLTGGDVMLVAPRIALGNGFEVDSEVLTAVNP